MWGSRQNLFAPQFRKQNVMKTCLLCGSCFLPDLQLRRPSLSFGLLAPSLCDRPGGVGGVQRWRCLSKSEGSVLEMETWGVRTWTGGKAGEEPGVESLDSDVRVGA